MPSSAHCSLLLAVTALCYFGVMVAFPMEGIIMDNHCRCLSTIDSRISTRLFHRMEIVPAGPHCRNSEIIITLKDKKVVCVEPEADWIQKLIYKILKKPAKKERKSERGAAKEVKQEEDKKKKKEKQKIDDTGRHKPYGLTAWTPIDDVYVVRHYPKPVYDADVAVDMLKSFQKLDFTPEDQPIFIELKLDLKLEKKKKVDPFVSTVHIPHLFKKDLNKVVVFTENSEEARVATEHGATIVGGTELIEKILEDEITADFYVAVPDIIPKLLPLKNKLRKKFPKSKRGSVGVNIPKMLHLFKSGHEYMVERETYIYTQVGTLDMSKDHILDNMRVIIQDVASHKPAELGSIIERAITNSQTSEGLRIKYESFLQQEVKED
ncbi:39S ribosomal protein L1, mitochondrial [Bagarius yarrelli]|uniref:Large ribosomal subunit protein uL1m n=1 Tax=Bagarius yarrelli TaxID=175774 RepID=A0A556U841_BAGYA|nr:39S ribosomal protein L1, mitochondrial [Bagarius yarrelli]